MRGRPAPVGSQNATQVTDQLGHIVAHTSLAELSELRQEYTWAGLDESDLAPDPVEQFRRIELAFNGWLLALLVLAAAAEWLIRRINRLK